MAFDNSYRFKLDGVVVYPLVGNELNYEYSKFEGSYSFRKKLATKIKFRGDDFDNIDSAAVDYRFSFLIEKYDGADWLVDYTGYFFKTDCAFNQDDKILEVSPTPDDGYEDAKKALNNRYDLIKLLPDAYSVFINSRPVLQLLWREGLSPYKRVIITNIVGTSTWEEIVDGEWVAQDFLDMGFTALTFVNEDGGETSFTIYERYLTDNPTAWSTTAARIAEDISAVAPNYKYTSTDIVSGGEVASGAVQDDPTIYGKVISSFCDVSKIGKYFSEYISPLADSFAVPIAQSTWLCYSIWYIINPSINDYEIARANEVELKDCYSLAECIQLLLAQNTDIVHEASEDYSEILYGTNPIADSFTGFITPKSNVINYFYTQPARRAEIRLNDILDMFAITMKIFWFIEVVDGEKRLRLEHISWFENGGIYGSQAVEIDLTQIADPRTSLPYSYYQNKYEYNKVNMPYRYEYAWMDNVSDVFEGSPINILSEQVEPGNVEKKQVNNFSSDIDLIISNQGISLDGFCLIFAELDAGNYRAPYVDLEIKGGTFAVQNGLAAFTYLIPNYLFYGLPASSIEYDGTEYAALSVTRNKQQEVEFAILGQEINPLKLITTGLGSGQVDKMTLNLINFKYKIILNHDTE